MSEINKAVRGTQDVLPRDSYKWQYIERTLLETAQLYGFNEIRLPVFEHTELFNRSVGDTTDVVQKEMYTFEDKGGRSITLRPEGTAGAVRSLIEHGLFSEALPVKMSYVISCYRYEKPQAGRLREFHQFGVECFGAASPAADAELISMVRGAFDRLGIKGLTLEINSIGCPTCRASYLDALREYFSKYTDELCETCNGRLERNPMRILDCKSPVCSKIAAGAPKIVDYLCDECKEHFEGVKENLTAAGISYALNPDIVRGLDYYTRTVFEFVSTDIGAQGTVCGGGRYDGLVKEMGGPQMHSLGFAMGLERLMLVMEKQGCEFPPAKTPDIYIAPMGDAAGKKATELVKSLRDEGFYALTDLTGRGLKAQMKYADKCKASYTVVLGENELETGVAEMKNMETGEKKQVELNMLVDKMYDVSIDGVVEKILDSDTLLPLKGSNE